MLADILKIKKGVTAVIGSGGKTTLMYKLAEELSQNSKVIVCTTTQIFKPEHIITLISPSEEDVKKAFEYNSCICVGCENKKGKLTKPDIGFSVLKTYADYIITEADGSRGLPLKAHAEYEPVIPKESVKTIVVLGIKGIGNAIKDACHRPQLYADILKTDVNAVVTPKMAAEVLTYEGFGDLFVLNQVVNKEDIINAEIIAEYMDKPVYAGEIERGELHVCSNKRSR